MGWKEKESEREFSSMTMTICSMQHTSTMLDVQYEVLLNAVMLLGSFECWASKEHTTYY